MTLKIAITPGEPAGIGPDLVVMLAQKDWPVQLIVCANKELMQQRAAALKLPLQLLPYDPNQQAQQQQAGTLSYVDFALETAVVAGQLNEANGRYVVDTLRYVGEKSMSGEFDAIVTGPVHKGIINKAGIPFSGHTEFFCSSFEYSLCSDDACYTRLEGSSGHYTYTLGLCRKSHYQRTSAKSHLSVAS